MRVVEFDGLFVRKQKRQADGKIRVTFYDPKHPPRYVTEAEWVRGATNRYYPDGTSRAAVVRGT